VRKREGEREIERESRREKRGSIRNKSTIPENPVNFVGEELILA
jgi:hypothetical protein